LAARKIVNRINPTVERVVVIKHSEVRQFIDQLKEILAAYMISIETPLEAEKLTEIAQATRLHITLYVETCYGACSNYTREFNPGAPVTVRLYCFADQGGCHYQVIAPNNVTVQYVDDLVGDFCWSLL
jgi:hypothetical protein